ncbi:MAG: WD40 repeat domain-containing protein [Anaerolineales bacterium]|nr:WD40 repeat domain-containing protein [Anaerolineales bacterium]
MPFRPMPNETIMISDATYTFTEHPAAPGMAYGQAGRRGTVYQVADAQGRLWALKVFLRQYREPRLAGQAEKIRGYASIPGLQVCHRTVITGTQNRTLLRQYPDLAYAVLMPWVNGKTWQEILMSGEALETEKVLQLVSSLLLTLGSMEERGLSHCDLSGPNVIFTPANQAALVDLEELYSPDLVQPEQVPGGSPGYGHKTSPQGLWNSSADRFAGAVLIAEILGWSEEGIRKNAWGEGYFDPQEVGTNCERYRLLKEYLKEKWGNHLAEVFQQAWESETLKDCSMFAEWLAALPEEASLPSKSISTSDQEHRSYETTLPDPEALEKRKCPVCGKSFTAELAVCPFCESGENTGGLSSRNTTVKSAALKPGTLVRDSLPAQKPGPAKRKKGIPWQAAAGVLAVIGIGLWSGGLFGDREKPADTGLDPVASEAATADYFLPAETFNGISVSSLDPEAHMAPAGALLRSGHGKFNDLAYSAEGSYFAMVTDIGIFIHDAKSLDLMWCAPSNLPLLSVAWSPGSAYLAVGDSDGNILILASSNGELLAYMDGRPLEEDEGAEEEAVVEEEPNPVGVDAGPDALHNQRSSAAAVHGGHTHVVTAVAWSPDGRYLASISSWDDNLIIWDMLLGERRFIREVDPRLPDLAWDSSSSRVAFNSADRVNIFDLEKNDIYAIFNAGEVDIESFAWSPDSRWMAVGVDTRTVYVKDVASGSIAFSLPDLEGDPIAMDWSPDSSSLVIYDEWNGGLTWDPQQGKKLVQVDTGVERFILLQWSPDGSQLAGLTDDGKLMIYDAGSGREVHSLPVYVTTHYASEDLPIEQGLAWSPDNSQLVAAMSDNEIKIWTAGETPGMQSYTVCDWLDSGNGVRAVAWQEDGASVLVGCPDGTLRSWPDIDRVVGLSMYAEQDIGPIGISFSPMLDSFLSYSPYSEIVGQRINGGEIFEVTPFSSEGLHSLSWSPDQDYAAFGYCSGYLYVSGLFLGGPIREFSGNSCIHVDWSPSSDSLLYTYMNDEEEGILWVVSREGNNESAGEGEWRIQAHASSIVSTTWSPDGKWIATGAENGEIKIWEAETGDWWRTMTGHLGSVVALAWSPDGSTLASLSRDNSLIQWDVSDLQ